MELPPRARRIPAGAGAGSSAGGTTSACAENTCFLSSLLKRVGNYLRVRGEYCSCRVMSHNPLELPPRARRIPAEEIPEGL